MSFEVRLVLVCLILLFCEQGQICVADGDGDESARPGTLAELLDFRGISKAKPWRTYQASGYDRGGGFYDSGNFLRIEGDRQYVMMDEQGPGCIDRMWFTYKSKVGAEPYDLVIWLDNDEQPSIRVDLDELFSNKLAPFVQPLAGICGSSDYPGRYSYVPIGFQKRCKVVLSPRADAQMYKYRLNSNGESIPHIYYQITYRRFNQDQQVRRFRWDMTAEQKKALAKLSRLWNARGASPWAELAKKRNLKKEIEIQPEGRTQLFDISGPGVIYELRISVDNPEKLWLEISWDDSAKPEVCLPLGVFFACSPVSRPANDVKGFWTGWADGSYYCFLPMPFKATSKIQIRSEEDKTAKLTAHLMYRDETPESSDGVFCATRYDYAQPELGENYIVANLQGAGHFVGLVMDRPGHMEGDDQFFVDGEITPSIHGTGTEDFFNFAWGLGHVGTYPLHGITIQDGSPICYRFHLPAAVPFVKGLRIEWEHGHDLEKGPNLDLRRYSGAVFYYKQPDAANPIIE